ncbi:MAG: hypothetical protein A3A82_01775 [Candidatus Pacebacteria bacterium RIFCSPLOWO2_01_FULL_47_12]|nr:MAG: hypothetical protein A3J60_01815 [Candidatus Pacebacteria bacterium RIFCSPHIGHO2_02_FULL_46_9]OGJ39416.1 MAG: hypothetical protein A3A82_01775 [Candidatus Pacebacteria bacterium RIFCSPLOWO2_01_FULL_47_12]
MSSKQELPPIRANYDVPVGTQINFTEEYSLLVGAEVAEDSDGEYICHSPEPKRVLFPPNTVAWVAYRIGSLYILSVTTCPDQSLMNSQFVLASGSRLFETATLPKENE